MQNTDLRPLVLSILRERADLLIVLTDLFPVGRPTRVRIEARTLRELRAHAARVLRARRPSPPKPVANTDALHELRELGSAIFTRLLPREIRDFLARSATRLLYLQLDDEVADIPWETAFDGEKFLGERFSVSRRISSVAPVTTLASLRPARDSLKVLLLRAAGIPPGYDAYCNALMRRLGAVGGLAAAEVCVDELSRRELLRLLGECDVAHLVGPVEGARAADPAWWQGGSAASIREIAGLPNPPQLLISENTNIVKPGAGPKRADLELAKLAFGMGLNVLVAETSLADAGGAEFMERIYRELARGSTLGEAIRYVRAETRSQGSAADPHHAEAALYGDAANVIFPHYERPPREDSRRQITIMSCDIVDSTRLLKTLGAERYSVLLTRYRNLCSSVVTSYGGSMEDPKGDGVLCFFGFPVAYEDSAIRCLRAAREIVAAVERLGFRVRIGIDTGQVVVSEGKPVGDAVHFATRLQSRAEPGSIHVSDATRQIVRGRFGFELVDGNLELKGFEDPKAVYRVLGEADAGGTDPFEVTPKLTPFVGREREIRQLDELWSAACAGGARAVLISGEAGIGKSRLAREFRRSLTSRGQRAIEYRCTPELANSAFHPVIDFLWRLLRIQDSDGTEQKLAKIDAALAPFGDAPSAAALIAALLSIPSEARLASPKLPADKQRQLTLDVMVNWIRHEAAQSALCLIVEDLNWIDPSTRELLDRLMAAKARLPLLLIVTMRSDAARGSRPGFPVHEIEVKGLSPESSRAMVIGVSGESILPSEIVRLLAARADGVPLFIEESTRMAVDLGVGAGAKDAASVLRVAVPATIHDLLMARLDRLESAKPVAQLGGTIGREFSLELLQAVLLHESSPMRIHNVAAQLDTLVRSGLLIEKGEAPRRSYFFKHALIRDAAYQSLWERDRKRLHRAIATVVAEQFKDLEETQPELLAYHYAEAGIERDALAYWERAARRATSRSAHFEAISHLTNALDIAGRLTQDADRDRIELRLQLLLAARLIATEGYGADRVERVYARALELCRKVRDDNALLQVQLGLEVYHFMRAKFENALAIDSQIGKILTRSPNQMHRLQSKWTAALILFHQGDLVSAVKRMDSCLEEHDKLQARPGVVQNVGVMCLCYSSWGQWELGYPDQALQRADKVVALSGKLDHRFNMGVAHGFCAAAHQFRGENEAARREAERAIKICDDHGFAVWLAHAKLMHGRALAELGEPAAGIEEMRQAYDMWAATGAVVTKPFYLAMRAEGLALANLPDDGLALLETAFEIVRKFGERYYEAEIRRLFGTLILQSAAQRGNDRSGEAERWLLSGLEAAQAANLHSLKLRCAISLAELWSTQGSHDQAAGVLAPAYEWFKEGKETRDLAQARALLERLRRKRATA